ncbi:copper chaperone PCu(A)C [Streptomyces alfalfae]|uniref:Copper chaperone PCu(A)C n=1 Tax=Streptomyces alfalfae TaxID=1642299 RepID=A0A7T4PHB8_9ACTN|nr:copper chaperone PCu(A)C [Streptomyces alfalfae]QQC90280.1 copper chaperone PCu(A)C [Streptomyces alfalfae]
MSHRTTGRGRALAGGAVALAATLALAGCEGSGPGADEAAKKPDLKVTGAYIPEPTMDDMAAGFLTVTNKGGAADTLTSATSDVAGSVTLHSTKGGAMKEEKSFGVPAGGELRFVSGGNHLMLEKLKRKPKRGEKVAMTLHFRTSDPITIEVPVKEATYSPGEDGGADASHETHMSHASHTSGASITPGTPGTSNTPHMSHKSH